MFIIVFNVLVMSYGYVNFLVRIRVNLFLIWKNLDVLCCIIVVCFFLKFCFLIYRGKLDGELDLEDFCCF